MLRRHAGLREFSLAVLPDPYHSKLYSGITAAKVKSSQIDVFFLYIFYRKNMARHFFED